jgi:hypothetical protein
MNGKRHGIGVLKVKDGGCKKGEWNNGVRVKWIDN